jgi:hypothetical protein
MKLQRRAGTSVIFIDTASEERLLEVQCDAGGRELVAFHLYDSRGTLVSDSGGPQSFPDGVEVRAPDNELLLLVPGESVSHLQYRLYTRTGVLMTCSDGIHTQVFRYLRMEAGKPPAGHRPGTPST